MIVQGPELCFRSTILYLEGLGLVSPESLGGRRAFDSSGILVAIRVDLVDENMQIDGVRGRSEVIEV